MHTVNLVAVFCNLWSFSTSREWIPWSKLLELSNFDKPKVWTMRSVSACKRYFLILPIAWNERECAWNERQCVFDMGNNGEVWIKRDSKVFNSTNRLNIMIIDCNRSIGSVVEKREENWIISVFDGLNLSILHKFQLMISSRRKLRFSKATARFPSRIKKM